MNESIYVWPDGSWVFASEYCWVAESWRGDDFLVISGNAYVHTLEGDVLIKETGELL